ncbi:hypothetical protein D9M71_768740 [compost metagenome]
MASSVRSGKVLKCSLETFEPKERTVALFTQLRGLLRNTKNTRWNTATLIFSFTRGGQAVDGLSEAHWL